MTNTFPAHLNEKGQSHVAAELDRLGLDWCASATCADIEHQTSFGGLVAGRGDAMLYEISNIQAGARGYGVFADIEILADEHVKFEPLDA